MELPAGTVIAGRYRIVRKLGQGATKIVYLADDRLAGPQVALALIQTGPGTDPTLAARFSREGKAASILRSPYSVRVFDVGKTDDGVRYMATEPVLGRAMDEALKYGGVDPQSAARWTLHVLCALAEAHACGIVHRDVKPENILLDPTADGEIARLTDFGLAKVLNLDLEGSFNLRTAQGMILGTPDYMPPEQWQGMRLDARADLYSVGVLLYELITGKTPFYSREVHVMCVRHMTEAPPLLPDTLPTDVRAYDRIIQRALAKRPEDRYVTATAMREALEGISGIRIPTDSMPEVPSAEAPRGMRAELLCEHWPGPVQLVASPSVILGRDPAVHVVVKCMPQNEQTAQLSRTISRRHARIDWRGGRAFLTDLSNTRSTTVNERPMGADSVELHPGDVISLGPVARMRIEMAAAAPGVLPAWARLVRVDANGAGVVTVLVLSEAKISSGADAAIALPAAIAAGDAVRIRARDGEMTVLPFGSGESVPLRDGQVLRVGGAVVNVAVER